MSEEVMNTKEVARYLDIHEKQVYGLIKSGRIPATKVTGKWIFPKRLIDEWIETNAKQGVKEARNKKKQEQADRRGTPCIGKQRSHSRHAANLYKKASPRFLYFFCKYRQYRRT